MSHSQLDRQQLAERLGNELNNSIQNWLPQMIQNLPDQLLENATSEDLLLQSKALLLLQQPGLDQELVLSNAHGNRITFISTDNRPGVLARFLDQLPNEKPLAAAQIFSSNDNRFIIDVFDFIDEQSQSETSPLPPEVVQRHVQGISQTLDHNNDEVLAFLNAIGSHNRQYATELLAQQFSVFRKVAGSDGLVLQGFQHNGKHHLILGLGHSTTRQLLQRAALYLGRSQIGIHSATCDDVHLAGDEVAMVTLRIDRSLNDNESLQLARLIGVDSEVVQAYKTDSREAADVQLSEIHFAAARIIRSRLNVSEQFRLSLEEVLRILKRFPDITNIVFVQILARFSGSVAPEHRFVPQRDTNELTERNVMQALIDLPASLQKSNIGIPNRQCLAFRIAAEYFAAGNDQPMPFGIFYVYGKGFDGFHVRFRDIARGGMRLVKTRNREHYLFESQRLFNEAYDLAWAQNLKNKDIPEGGSKAVVMCKPDCDPSYAGRRFVDGLLDLVLPDSRLNHYYQDDEFLYLGPDENVSPELIDWIVDNAEARKYQFFNTFISSKPKLGINHKEFGVTSEGVVVFLSECLRQKGWLKDNSFSVKLTGGPDGDVGGNAIRFLIRDFGTRVKIVGISDGSGCATDPQGLDHKELMRLVEANLPIAEFKTSLLSSEGRCTGIATADQQSIRNNMPFRVSSDVFLPCGGRPGSINQFNVEMFFDAQGQPVSEIVVEGANLFLTPAARDRLSAAGVWVIKDSSANKCGVICSSLEIVAGMLLTNQQFLELKTQYVREVVQLLKERAAREAVSLFQEKRRQPQVGFPNLSVQVSLMILRVSEAIEASQQQWTTEQWSLAERLIKNHLPPVLVSAAGDRLHQLPDAYRRQFASAILASDIVYSEGCRNLELMTDQTIQELGLDRLAAANKS